MSACLRLRQPDWQIDVLSLAKMGNVDYAKSAGAIVEAADRVFVQPKVAVKFSAIFSRYGRPVEFLPSVYFSGFHPDVAYFPRRVPKLGTPLGGAHSIIVAAAFLTGLSEARTAKLFNAFVYRRLGYFEQFAPASEFQAMLHSAAGWPLDDTLERWQARFGAFMHQPLHPVIAVLDDLAETVCARIGATSQTPSVLPMDELVHGACWPIYPELARPIGLTGSMDFSPENGPTIGLDEFIAGSFKRYRRAPPDRLVTERVVEAIAVLRNDAFRF